MWEIKRLESCCCLKVLFLLLPQRFANSSHLYFITERHTVQSIYFITFNVVDCPQNRLCLVIPRTCHNSWWTETKTFSRGRLSQNFNNDFIHKTLLKTQEKLTTLPRVGRTRLHSTISLRVNKKPIHAIIFNCMFEFIWQISQST